MTTLDERLAGAAALVLDCLRGKERPRAADIGCDHGYLTAYLLERCPRLRVVASDVSAPSLEKARRLLAEKGLLARAELAVADGLAALREPVDAAVMAGMGAKTILGIVEAGRDRLGEAALIVQANVDLPLLRMGLARLGYGIERECFSQAAGRQYVTLLARPSRAAALTEREALLGAALGGVRDEGQRAYFTWQRRVRRGEMERVASLRRPSAQERMRQNDRELTWISEALGMKTCTVADVERLVGEIAPYELAEEWDNVGLLFGHAEAEVTRVLVALDLTDEVLKQAKALGAQLIVTHHPIMFSARRRITGADREGALMLAMAEAGIAHIAAHTNLDSAPGGVNDTLLAVMGCENVRGEGFVRVGELPEGTTFAALCERAAARLHASVRAYGAPDRAVRALGCCSGAGGGEVAAAKALGADCFITGEIRHHEALDAVDSGVPVIEAGHYETENPVCEVLRSALQKNADALEYKLTVFCSKGKPFGR